MGLKESMPRVVRYEQNAEIKRRGNTDYLKTDARTEDGWRAIRTFNTSTGEWRLTALGKRYFADHDGLPAYVIPFRRPSTCTAREGRTRSTKADSRSNCWSSRCGSDWRR